MNYSHLGKPMANGLDILKAEFDAEDAANGVVATVHPKKVRPARTTQDVSFPHTDPNAPFDLADL